MIDLKLPASLLPYTIKALDFKILSSEAEMKNENTSDDDFADLGNDLVLFRSARDILQEQYEELIKLGK